MKNLVSTKSEMNIEKDMSFHRKVFIKKCHCCGEIIESFEEVRACPTCRKNFLPLHYFDKIMESSNVSYSEMFSTAEDYTEEDLVRGLSVLW